MAGVTNAQLLDMKRSVTPNLPKMEFETALKYAKHPITNRWFRDDKKTIHSGDGIKRNIVLDPSGHASHVRLYQRAPINVHDVQQQLTAPWVHARTYYTMERREALQCRTPEAYVDLLKVRRVDAMVDLANLMERCAWVTPVSADDDLNPRGIPYWLSFLANGATSAGGFDGQTIRFAGGTTATSKAGIDGALGKNALWRNYGFTYTAMNLEFINRLRRAFHATDFVAPVMAKDLSSGYASNFRLYMGLDLLCEYEQLATSANDNLGSDMDKFHGLTTFNRVPIIYAPLLDEMTVVDGGGSDFAPVPVIGVNHAKFFPFIQEGDWLHEDDPPPSAELNNVQVTIVDSSYQYFCLNVRQGGFIGHKMIPSS